MGLLNILSPISNLFGGNDSKPVATPASVTPAAAAGAPAAEEQKTPAQIAEAEDQKKKNALLAVNAGGAQGTTVGGGNANVTRKILLGL